MKTKLQNFFLMLCSIFKDYPVTLGSTVILSAVYSITYYSRFSTRVPNYIIMFLAVYSVQALFTEELFREKIKLRIAAHIISIPIAVYPVLLYMNNGNYLFGADIYTIEEITSDVYITYFVFLIMISLHHMFVRSKESFDTFFLKTFSSVMQTSVIYGLFAGGLAIIVFIFDLLIFDTGHFLAKIEIFLAGGIYAPALLLALSGKKKETGKFAKICILYALEPLLILATAIIYIYIIKVFITLDIPRNTIFSIITWLFASGMVIWTLALGIDETNIFRKAAEILPFVFIPCIVLQAWCIFARIGEHGFTPTRYLGLFIVLFELIYMVLYLLKQVTKKDMVSYIFRIIPIMFFIAFWAPFINYASVSMRSQAKVFEGVVINEELPDSVMANNLGTSYDVIAYDCGFRGKAFAKKMFSEDEASILKRCIGTSHAWRTEVYFNESKQLADFDISKYKRITRVHGNANDLKKNFITLETDGVIWLNPVRPPESLQISTIPQQ